VRQRTRITRITASSSNLVKPKGGPSLDVHIVTSSIERQSPCKRSDVIEPERRGSPAGGRMSRGHCRAVKPAGRCSDWFGAAALLLAGPLTMLAGRTHLMELLQGHEPTGFFDPLEQLLLGVTRADAAREAALPTQPMIDHLAQRRAMPAALFVVHRSRWKADHRHASLVERGSSAADRPRETLTHKKR
jgi:hypothetical protein